MRASRHLTALLCLLGALLLSLPAATLADGGGGSAGGTQYTDPFGGSSTPTPTTSHTTTATATATTPPATSTPTPTQSTPEAPETQTAPAATAPGTATAPDTATAPETATTPEASTGSGTDASTRSAGAGGRTLPFTGYDSWEAGALGAALLGSGIVIRRRTRRS